MLYTPAIGTRAFFTTYQDSPLKILLANDDGIHAPGILAMRKALVQLGDVLMVAPATEQSGVGHSITYLSPLTCKEIYDGEVFRDRKSVV